MTDLAEIKSLVVEQGQAWDGFAAETKAKIADLTQEIVRLRRPGALLPAAPAGYDRQLGEALRKAALGDEREIKGMSAGTDPEGGYLVIPQMDSVVRQIRDVVSPVSALARNIELKSGGEMLMPYFRGTLASSWVGELESRPATAPVDMGEHRVVLHEVYAMPQVSQKLLDTANYDVGAILVDQIAHGLATAEAVAIHSGNGVNRPRGFTTHETQAAADATRTWGKFEHIATGVSGAFAAANQADVLVDTVSALAPQYRPRANWLMSRSTAGAVRKFRDDLGQFLWAPSLQAGQPDRLLGYPVTISDDVPAVAASSLAIWFGDWSAAYTVVRMPGLRLLRDPYSTKGQIAFYAYQRVGGAAVDFNAIKTVKFATS